ncbi:ketoacyl-ACP synthase III [Prosthecobacter sp. SYSU 5D2]|uniref:ketoacyl-ACP synthase III n=1 Tax=Prosthecobacter sp. SYSU 5D2 TaxID=3134134 RepID=UPI0031FEA284
MKASILAIDYHLPLAVLTNGDLAGEFPEWNEQAIFAKTGITERHIAATDEYASDLAFAAATKLFSHPGLDKTWVEALVVCTQSPDYLLPSTACLLQDRLGLSRTVAAFDFTLGCSGFVYGLSLVKGMIESGQIKNAVLVTADTYSKYLGPADRSVRTLFGDGAAACWITAVEQEKESIGPFVFGTDGSGASHLMLRQSASRGFSQTDTAPSPPCYLTMNGPEIFRFTLDAVPASVQALCVKAGTRIDEVDLFVFHQANVYMLEHLRQKINIPTEKFYVHMQHCGNTVSSTIPIALKEAVDEGRLKPGMNVMLVGFGVGLSWAATFVRWGDFKSPSLP